MFEPILLLITLLLAALVEAYANPGACSGACYSHDPAVIQRASDGVYFRFSTGSGIQITKSSSLSGPWTAEGYALASGSKISVSGNSGSDLWASNHPYLLLGRKLIPNPIQAPDVHQVGSTYYMYYAVSSFGSQNSAIGLATSTTMEVGSWTDHGSIGVSSTTGSAYNTIDPNLIDVAGTYYLNFGSFWSDIYQIKMNSNPTSSSGSAYQMAFNGTGSHAEEGSYMFFYGGYYYLLISSGTCCGYQTSKPAPGAEYRIIMCRSKSATGSFVSSLTPIRISVLLSQLRNCNIY